MVYNGIINDLVGKKVYGFCNGYFGRDSYDDKEIIANGLNWVLAVADNSLPELATFENRAELHQWFKDNSVEKDTEYN